MIDIDYKDLSKCSIRELRLLLASGIKGEEYKAVLHEYLTRRRV